MLSFATRTWDGWDYIPHAWPEWIAATDGVLLVGEPADRGAVDAGGERLAPGRAIAVARVAMTGPGEAWLEGIRVDPRVRGMDVATDLQVAELHIAAGEGAHVVRYATGQRNEGSHRLGARHGFELLTELRTWWWSETGEDQGHDEESAFDPDARARATEKRRRVLGQLRSRGRVADAPRADELWRLVSADATFERSARLYEHRAWALQELTRELFDEHMARGEVLVAEETANAAALAILPAEALPAEDVSLHIGLLVGNGRAALGLASEVRRLTQEPIRFRLPDGDHPMPGITAEDLREAGFFAREWLLHILGRPLDAGSPPPPIDPAALAVELETVEPLRR